MNLLEARLILQCRKTKSTKEVWSMLYLYGHRYSYWYIATKLRNLADLGYLKRREINAGRRGRIAYYTATPQAIVKAMNYVEERMRKGSANVTNANLRAFTTR